MDSSELPRARPRHGKLSTCLEELRCVSKGHRKIETKTLLVRRQYYRRHVDRGAPLEASIHQQRYTGGFGQTVRFVPPTATSAVRGQSLAVPEQS